MPEWKLAENLRELRTANEYPQQYVSERIHLARQTYSHKENGKPIPDIRTVCCRAALYHVSVAATAFCRSKRQSARRCSRRFSGRTRCLFIGKQRNTSDWFRCPYADELQNTASRYPAGGPGICLIQKEAVRCQRLTVAYAAAFRTQNKTETPLNLAVQPVWRRLCFVKSFPLHLSYQGKKTLPVNGI